eukprot:c10020_g1_i2.p1 GENE.c10020_g1_i2~~c10020_g1_i2.p1  ORF type:complete len:716 (-),score=154.44 c10020_g1_i2:7-2154(-)
MTKSQTNSQVPDSLHVRMGGAQHILNLLTTLQRITNLDDPKNANESFRIVDSIWSAIGTDDSESPLRDVFRLCGGVEALVRLLFLTATAKQRPTGADRDIVVRIQIESLKILREMCCTVPHVAENMSSNTEFIRFVFELMKNKLVFEIAVGLQEEIMAYKSDTFDLTTVPQLKEFVLSLSPNRLAVFCRVLALVVFEPEDRLLQIHAPLNASQLLSFRKTDNKVALSHIETNHNFLLDDLELLPLLVKLMSIDDHAKDMFVFPIGAVRPHDPAEWDDEFPFMDLNQIIANVPNPLTSWHQLTLAAHQVEVIFVVCRLLNGKRKAEVQQKLSDLGLIQLLVNLFDNQLRWNEPSQPPHRHEPLHGPGCSCNPDTALKIQYLRLIHNFCDRDVTSNVSFTRLLLSVEEIRMVQDGISSDIPESLLPIASDTHFPFKSVLQMDKSKQGLISRLVQLLMEEPSDPGVRFWLSSCVEAFVRSSGPIERRFIASCGLLQHLVKQIALEDSCVRGCLQSNFDVLGEVLKFNIFAISQLNAIFNDERIFDRFCHAVRLSLVDSNVFVRSLILSLDHFCFSNASNTGDGTCDCVAAAHVIRQGKIFRYIEQKQITLLRQLIGSVHLSTLSLDNLCCINTALVFFIFSYRQGAFDQSIANLVELQSESVALVDNFLDLLEFWVEYYHHSQKDSHSLSFSSKIPFTVWHEVVEHLLDHFRPNRNMN